MFFSHEPEMFYFKIAIFQTLTKFIVEMCGQISNFFIFQVMKCITCKIWRQIFNLGAPFIIYAAGPMLA